MTSPLKTETEDNTSPHLSHKQDHSEHCCDEHSSAALTNEVSAASSKRAAEEMDKYLLGMYSRKTVNKKIRYSCK